MPGKVNPTQAEALTMIAVQVMANDVAVGFGGAGGYLEDECLQAPDDRQCHAIYWHFVRWLYGISEKYLVEGTQPNHKRIAEYLQRSLMLVTALSPVIGYDKAAAICSRCPP